MATATDLNTGKLCDIMPTAGDAVNGMKRLRIKIRKFS